MHGREYAVMVGNATMGIALTLKAAGIIGKKVAIPNNVCINVPMAVMFSGNEPVYIDICKDDYGLDPERLVTVIEEVDAVIAVHSYGYPCKIQRIEQLCEQSGTFLIEDLAVAQGAEIDGKMAGGFGNVSIISFGAGKIIDVGHGGVILTDNYELLLDIKHLLEVVSTVMQKNKEVIEMFGSQHTKLYNKYYNHSMDEVPELLGKAMKPLENQYQYQFDKRYSDHILSALVSLSDNLYRRVDKYEKFYDVFCQYNTDIVETIALPEGAAPWRFNILVKKGRDTILRQLILQKKKISSWHPSVDHFLEHRCKSGVDTPVSDWLGDIILNMWINDDVDDRYINNISRIVCDHIEGQLIEC
jgi:dTDP-4-amino-4,6-dideoxygalactose transaminase